MVSSRIDRAFAFVIAGLCLTLSAGPLLAGIADTPLPAGTEYLYSVTGVVNGGGVGTFFTCTSTSTDPQNVTVEVFNETGAASGTGTLVVAPGASVRFVTANPVATALTGTNLGSGGIVAGAARILSTVKGKLLCTASLADLGQPNVVGHDLPIVAKLKQKAHN